MKPVRLEFAQECLQLHMCTYVDCVQECGPNYTKKGHGTLNYKHSMSKYKLLHI